MKLGLNSTATNIGSIDDLVDDARRAADAGLHSMWSPTYFGMDALTAIAVAAREVPGLKFGTSIVPIFTRHPFAMAQQALTVQAVTDGRLTLGLGLSHRQIVEDVWGLDYSTPTRTMRTYLDALNRFVRGGDGPESSPTQSSATPTAPNVRGAIELPIVVAALGPAMLDLAGAMADGVVLWCVGPRSLEQDVVPRLAAAAQRADRQAPRVVASLPVAVTSDPESTRSRIAARFAQIDRLPSYRRALDAEGVGGIADISLVGDATTVRVGLRQLEHVGVTEFTAMIVGGADVRAATLNVLADW